MGARRVAIIARSWPLTLALLLAGALLFILSGASGILFLVDGECSAYGCGDSLAEMFVVGLGCALLVLIAAVAIPALIDRPGGDSRISRF